MSVSVIVTPTPGRQHGRKSGTLVRRGGVRAPRAADRMVALAAVVLHASEAHLVGTGPLLRGLRSLYLLTRTHQTSSYQRGEEGMMNRDERREGLRRTAERLGGECGGAIPPGQILALLFRLHYALAIGFPEEGETGLLHMCEVSARAILRRQEEGTGLKSPSLNGDRAHPGIPRFTERRAS